MNTVLRGLLAAAGVSLLVGCASTAVGDTQAQVQEATRRHLGAELRWLTGEEARREARVDTDRLLAKPLEGDDAVRIALAYSPSLQALLHEGSAASADIAQGARLPNPVFAFERLVRNEAGARETEIGRVLSFSVADLLLWPARQRQADHRLEAQRLQLAVQVVRAATEARQAWVQAVAAQQSLRYAEQVMSVAESAAELARRMEAAGNFSKLQRAREQAFAGEAQLRVLRARQAAIASREALVRALGLDEGQAAALTLPERLPDLPKTVREETAVLRSALDQRLDLQLARANLAFTAREQGLSRVERMVDGLEFGLAHNSETGRPPQKGFSVELPLPLFDAGGNARGAADARYIAAFHRTAQQAVFAGSQARESYGAYRSAWELARHHRDEVVPLRKAISDETLLRYNGMFIGVFELLADAREQVTSVVQALEAQRDFWLADAALQATLLGAPTAMPATSSVAEATPAAAH